jgi:hypothetical protein
LAVASEEVDLQARNTDRIQPGEFAQTAFVPLGKRKLDASDRIRCSVGSFSGKA